MTEKLQSGNQEHYEKSRTPEQPKTPELETKKVESRKSSGAEKRTHQETLRSAELTAKKSQEVLDDIAQNTGAPEAKTPTYTNKHLREMSFSNTMNHTRQQFNPALRSFSKFIHTPVVESVSEATAKTVGRNSALMGGSLSVLIIGSVVLVVAKRTGFEIRPSLFILLFLGGTGAGLLIELLIKLVRKARS